MTTARPDELDEYDAAERAYRGGKAPANPFGKGGRAGAFARKHQQAALDRLAEVVNGTRNVPGDALVQACVAVIHLSQGK